MKNIRLAINGFGRIGRLTTRALMQKKNIDLVAINDLTEAATLSHLFKYDSVHRMYNGQVSHGDKELIIDGRKIKVFAEKDPSQLPWKNLEIDIVLECTGKFVSREGAGTHLKAGAKRVIISAPAKGDVKTIVLGVNENILKGDEDIVSNASCTTNNVAPMIKVLHEKWGVSSGYITTIHAYTGDQNIHDGPHKDLRRARAAAVSMIPTTTGAAKAITEIFPELKGKLGGAGIRVPVINGSLTDLTCIMKKMPTVEEVNAAFKKEAEGALKGIMQYTDDPIVSVDIIGNSHSCIFDAKLTSVVGDMVKVLGWYDNEYGYSCRLADLVEKMGLMEKKNQREQVNA